MRTDANGYCALLYGHDDLLLKTRGWLLSSIGCISYPVLNAWEYQQQISVPSIALVVMCQTMSSAECDAAAAMAAELRSDVPLLILFNRHRPSQPGQNCVLFDATRGPAAFLEVASRLLMQPALLASA